MTTENVGDPITISTKAASAQVDTKAAVATVAEPRVAQLVEKAGEAVLRAEAAEYVANETGRAADPRVMEELAELKGQLKAYREQVNSMQTSKMHYAENSRSYEQFSDRDKSNAIFLSKAPICKIRKVLSNSIYHTVFVKLRHSPPFFIEFLSVYSFMFTLPGRSFIIVFF